MSAVLTCVRLNKIKTILSVFHLPIRMLFFLDSFVSILVAPAPAAKILESFTLRLKVLTASKPTQELDAPVSKLKRPFTPFKVALISKCLV